MSTAAASSQHAEPEGSARPWYRRWSVRFGIASALVLTLSLLWLAGAWLRTGRVVTVGSLELATVTRGDFVDDVGARGSVTAAVHPTLYSAAPGTVSYLVHAGDRVVKGQVLARLRSPDLHNEYERERTTLESMNAALAQKRIELQQELLANEEQANLAAVTMNAQLRDLQRSQQAWGLQIISAREYEAAYDDFSVARLNFEHARQNAGLERARILLDLRTRELACNAQALLVKGLKQRLEGMTIRSPVNGVVAEVSQSDQAHVASNVPLVTVVDLSALAIRFQVAESLAYGIKPGLPADITLGGQTAKGVVTSVSPDVEDGLVTGRVRFVVPQPFGLRQNEQAAVRIVLGLHHEVLKVERGAFLGPRSHYAYVLRGDQVVRVPVEIGASSKSELEVLAGLSAGDRIVISDPSRFHGAPRVRVVH